MADPGRVTAKALRDSIAGKELSVYGLTMKVFHLLCGILPHGLILTLMDAVSQGAVKQDRPMK